MDCSTPIQQQSVGSPGQPGGTLPAGGDQWSFLQFNGTLWVPSWVMPETVTALETGEVLLVTDDNVAALQDPIGKSLLYRNGANLLSSTAIWLHQWTYASGASATAAEAGFAVALRDGNLRWLVVSHSSTVVHADITYTVVVNGVDTALSTTLNSGSRGPALDLLSVVPVVQGDLISLRADGATSNITLRVGANFFLEY